MGIEVKQIEYSSGVSTGSPSTLRKPNGKVYTLTFSNESSKQIDTSSDSIDAQRAIIQPKITDRNGTSVDYEITGATITSPDADTIDVDLGGTWTGVLKISVIDPGG